MVKLIGYLSNHSASSEGVWIGSINIPEEGLLGPTQATFLGIQVISKGGPGGPNLL